MIELVIKIPEEQYNTIKSDLYNTFPVEMRKWGLEAIRNGTPLPNGHGRLIDANALTEKAPEIQEYLDVLAPTIIEEDKIDKYFDKQKKDIDPDYEDILKKIREAGESDD